jgi:hypothetical protein
MVLWCECGAFMGVRKPLDDWTVDRTGLCPECVIKKLGLEELAKKGIEVDPPANEQKKED